MTISNLKDLESLIKLLRKQGVAECTVDGMHLKLGDPPPKKQSVDTTADEQISTPPYTDEQILLWSAGNV